MNWIIGFVVSTFSQTRLYLTVTNADFLIMVDTKAVIERKYHQHLPYITAEKVQSALFIVGTETFLINTRKLN